MKTVVISMTVDDDPAAWGPGATKKNMPANQAAYRRVAQRAAKALFGPRASVSIDIDFVAGARSRAIATIYDGVNVDGVDINAQHQFCDRVWREFCAK